MRRFSVGALSSAGLFLFTFFLALLSSVMPQKADAWGGSFSMANTGGLSWRSRICDTFTTSGITPGTTVTVEMKGSSSGSGSMGDPFVHVFNSSGGEVRSDDDAGVGRDSYLTVRWEAGYYIGASVYGGDGIGSTYYLYVSHGTWSRGSTRCNVQPKSNQSISFGTIAGRTFSPEGQFNVSATATSGLPVSFTSSTTTVCTVSTVTGTATVTMKNAGSCSITASQGGNESFNAASSVTQTFTISKANQTITFGSIDARTYSATPFIVSASASSGLAPTFSSLTTSTCSVSGSSVTMLASGSCTIRASQSGNTNYNAATSVDQTFAIAKANQTITFNSLADRAFGSNFTTSATSSSGLAVTFSSQTTGICTTSGTNGSTITTVEVGTCIIRATQAGNTQFNVATEVDRSFTVTQASQTLTFSALTGKTYGEPAYSILGQATSTSGLLPVYSSATPSVCSTGGTNGVTVTIVAAGSCTINADQPGTSRFAAAPTVSRSFTVSPKTLTAASSTVAARLYNGTTTAGAVTVGPVSGLVGNETLNISATASAYSSSDVSRSNLVRFFAVNRTSSTYASGKGVVVTSSTAGLCNSAWLTQISADWGTGGPSGCNADNYSTYFEAVLVAPVSGTFTFYNSSDDGFYLTIDGTAVIDNWVNQGSSLYNGFGTISLVQGRAYTLRAWHYENGGGSVAKLYWAYPGQSEVLVPSTAFVGSYPTTITYSLADGGNGGLASNYTLASNSALGVITPRPLTFKMDDIATDADNNTSRTFTATPTGLAPTDSVNTWTTTFTSGVSSTTTAPSATTVGTYTMTPSSLALTNGAAAVPLTNYLVTYQTGTYAISAGAPSKVSVPVFSGTSVSGRPFSVQPVVRVLDAANNLITTGPAATAEVKAIITTGTNRELVGTTTINALEGTARFTNLGISGDASQTYTIEYSATYRVSADDVRTLTVATQSVRPTFGAATALRISREASGARSGIALSTQPTVDVVDDRGNVVTNSTATVTTSLQGAGATLSGTIARSASSGIASSFNMVLTGTAREAGSQTPLNLVFSSPGLTSVTQEDVPLAAGNASKLTLTQRSEGTASGAVFTTQPEVMLFDASNNVVDNVSATVTATLTQVSGTGSLVGGSTTTTATAAVATSGTDKGIAKFSGLGITGLQNTTYSVTYSATVGGVVLTPARQDITVSVGAPTSLVLTTNASGAASGTQVSTQPRIILRDSGGNNVTSSIHNGTVVVTAVKSTDSSVSATVSNGSVALTSGVAQWSQLSLYGEATTYSLTYTYTGTNNSITLTRPGSLVVGAGVAAQLMVSQSASSSTASGVAIPTQPIIAVADAFGNTVTSSSAVITATMSGGSGTLAGTVARAAVSGVATYSGLSIRGVASSGNDASKYVLTFSSPGLTSATQTQKISLTHGAANKTVVTNAEAIADEDSQAGKALAVSPIVQIQDAWNNVVTTGSWATASIRPTAVSGTLLGSTPVAAVAGEATLSNVGVNGTAGSRYVVQYQAYIGSTTLSASTHDVNLIAGDPSRLRLSTSPVGTASGSAFTTQPVVAVVDSNGNVTTSTQTVTATIGSGVGGTLVGTTTKAAVNGTATFTNLGISGTAGVTYRIDYSVAGTSITATSSSVTVTPGAPAALRVKTASSSAVASGSNLATAPVVKIVDATGNTVTTSTANVTVSLASGSPDGSLLGTTTRQAVNGEATFSSLGIRAVIGRYTLEFSSSNLTPDTQTQTINVTPGPAARIVAVNAAALAGVNAPAGGVLATQPVLRVTDISGNAVGVDDGARATITPSISTGATLVNSSAVKTCAQGGPCAVGDTGPAGGIIFYVAPTEQPWGRYLEAARNGWNGTVNDPSVNYGCSTLIAGAQGTDIGTGATNTSAILAACSTSGIAARVADNYSVTVGGVVYNDWFVGSRDENYQLYVNRAVFGAGNLPTMLWNSNNLADVIAGHLNMEANGAEGGAHKTAQSMPVRPIRAVAGPAASVGVSGVAPTVYTMTYSGTFSTRTLTSAAHTVTAAPGAATKLALTAPAVGTASGEVFTTQPRVTLRDVANNTVTTDDVVITMTITQVSGKGTLVGGASSTTATATTVDGVATFSGIGIAGTAGQAYTVTYSAPSLTSTTQSITVTPGVPAALTFTNSSSTVNSGAAFATQPVVRVVDATGNLVTTSSAPITATISRVGADGLDGELIGQTSIRAVNGVATFTNLGVIGTASVQYELSYSTDDFAAQTQTVTVQPGSPVSLALGNSPSTSVVATAASVALGTQPQIVLKDSAGNVTVRSNVTVTASISVGGSLSGTTTATTNASGMATFSNLSVGAKVGTYTLTYSATGYTPVAHTVTPSVGPAARIIVDDSVKKIKAASGAPFNIDGQVRIVDAAGNTVNTNAAVTATTAGGIGELTFDNCGKTGAYGPSLSDCQTTYDSWADDANSFSVTNGVQAYKAPVTGTYRFEVVGAHGAASTGAANTRGGRSVKIVAEKTVNAGQWIYILVGQAGTASSVHGGGGGASFINIGSRTATTNLIIAGGGGGTRQDATSDGGDATTNQSGMSPGSSYSSRSVSTFVYNTSANGFQSSGDAPLQGDPANAYTSVGFGGLGAGSCFGDGGAGWAGDGSDDSTASTRAVRLALAATGGIGGSADGGFGGGASGQGCNGGGGGGGYTGGNGGWVAGGGGSYGPTGFTYLQSTIDSSRSYLRNGTPVHGYVKMTLPTQSAIAKLAGVGSTNSVTADAVNGAVPLSALSLTGAEGDYTVTYSATVDGTTLTTDSNVVNLTAGAASHVVLTTSAVGAKSDSAFVTQPQVAMMDAASGGNLVASLNSGTALTMTAASGTLSEVKALKGIPITSATTGYCHQATKTQIKENWGQGSPCGGSVTDNFAVYWTGQLTVPTTRDVVFKTATDDGFYLKLNGSVVIDDWEDQGANFPNATSTTRTLEAGKTYVLEAWMYENGNNASAELYWDYSGPAEVIPASYFAVPKVEARIKTAPAGATGYSLVGTSQVDVVSGIATFTNLGIKGPIGTYTLEYVSGSLTASTQTITVVAGDPSALNVAATSTLQAGAELADQAVTIVDTAGNPIITSSSTITATLTSANAANITVRGTKARGAVNGVATFDDLVMFGIADTYVLTFSTTVGSTTLTATQNVTVTPGAAVRLDVQEFETAAVMMSGELFTPQPKVRVVDTYGNAVTTQPNVTFTLEQVAREGQSSGSLVGADVSSSTTKTITAGANGVAQFTGLGISGVDQQSYRVVISSGSVTPYAQTFRLTTGAPTEVVLVSDAGEAQSNKAMGTQPVVEIRDSGGNVVDVDGATVTISSSAGATFSPNTALTTDGVARFSNVALSGPAAVSGTTYTVTYSATINQVALSSDTQSLVLTPGDVDELQLTRTASDESAGEAFGNQPVVSLVDASDNPVNVNGTTVRASIECGAQPTSDCTAARLLGASEVEVIDGVATFTDLGIGGRLATYAVKYSLTIGSTTYTDTENVVILGGAPARMELTTSPTQGTVGDAFGTQPVITFRDSSGNVANSTQKVTASVTTIDVYDDVTAQQVTTGELVGTTEKNAVSGVASFDGTGLGLKGRVGQSYVITYSATGLTPVTQAVSLLPGSPVTMTVVQGIGDASSATTFGQQPIIELYDVGGNLASGTTQVTAAVTSVPAGGGTLSGTHQVSASSGRVVFTDLLVTGKVGAYTVTFTANGLTSRTSSFDLNPGAPSRLSLATAATSPSESGVAFTSQPIVELHDAQGNVITDGEGVVIATISNGVGGTLRGVARAALSSGIAEFETLGLSGLTANNPYTILYSLQGSSVTAVSQEARVAAGPAAGLSLQASTGTQVGVAFADQSGGSAPVVRIVDSGGNTIENTDAFSSAVITATISSGGTLIGDVDIAASQGIVTFSDLGLVGTNNSSYTITYSTPGLASVSQVITATTGPASQIGITTAADGARSGAVMSTQPVIQLKDAGNNPVSQAGVSVSVSAVEPDAVLTGTRTVTTNGSGIASFGNSALELNGPLGVDYTLEYSAILVSGDPSSAVTTSQTLRVQLGDPYKLSFVEQPAGNQVGQRLTTQPIIEVQDFGGNTVGTSTDAIGVSIERLTSVGDASKLAGTVTATAPSTRGGIAEFTDLSFVGTTGETYRLTFASGDLETLTYDLVATTGVASQITVETASSAVTAAAGVVFSQPVVVKIRDVGGNVVDSSSTITAQVSCVLSPCAAPVLSGDTTETAVNGTATFDNLTLVGIAGNRPTLTFELSGVDTDTFTPTISVGPVVQLGVQPLANNAIRAAQSGMELSPPPIVELQDAGGNRVVDASINGTEITAEVEPVVIGGVPTGQFVNAQAAVATTTVGVAQFSGLSLTGVNGVSYTITYSANLGTVQNPNVVEGSEVVGVTTGISTNIALSTPAVGTRSGVAFTTPPSVTIRDTGGNTVENSTYSVRATLTPVEVDGVNTGRFEGSAVGERGDTALQRTVSVVNGVATFTGLGITGTAGETYTITYTAIDSDGNVVGSHPSVRQDIEVSVGPAVSIALIQSIEADQLLRNPAVSPVRPVSGQVFATQPIVEVRDSGGNRVTSSSATITAQILSASDSSTTRTTHRTLFTQPGSTVTDIETISVDAVDGVASFESLGIKGKDSVQYTIQFSTDELEAGASDTDTQVVQPIGGAPSQIVITQSGASSGSAPSGAAFGVQPQITIRDAQGNTSVSSTSRILATLTTVDINGVTTGELVGTAYADAVAGVATFSDLGLTGTKDQTYTITYSLDGVPSISEQYTVGVGASTKLRFVTSASGAVAGEIFTTQPQIEVLDSGNNRTASTATVYVALTPVDVAGVETGELVGSSVNLNTGVASAVAVNGVATFSNVGVGGIADTAYTLTYSATDGRALSTVDQAVTPVEGAAVQVGVLREASDAVVGVPFAVQPRLAVQDEYGNVVRTSSATVVATVSEGGTLVGATTRQAVNGIVEFGNLGLRGRSGETYTLSYSLVGFAPRMQDIALFAGAANRLTITQSASGAASGTEFLTEPRITINDADGNIVTTSNATVTVVVRQVSGTGQLLGTTSVAAVNGVATFSDLGLTGLNNTAYELTFSSTGLVSATQTVLVTTGPVTALSWDRQPSGSVVGAPFAVQPRIVLRDSGNNVVTSSTQPVTATISGVGGALIGQTSIVPVNGIATFTDLGFTGLSGSAYTVTYALNGATSVTQNISAAITGAPSTLELTQDVDAFVDGAVFARQPVITVKDAGGNVVSTPRVTVRASVVGTGGNLLGTVSRVSNNGEVRFSGLGITGVVGNSYTIRFTATGLPEVTQTEMLDAALAGLAPEFGAVNATADGFRVSITNFDPDFTYSGTATSGGLVSISSSGVITVSGLLPARQSTATITSSRNGYSSETRTVVGTALPSPALTPTFGVPVATSDGFTVQVTNYSTAFVWTTTTDTGASATLTTAGLLRVTGASPGQSVAVTVGTARFGFLSGRNTLTFAALQTALTPVFGDVTRTVDGFTAPITNYSALYIWTVSASSGAQASIDPATGVLEVSGLSAGQESTVTVATSRNGYARGSAVVTARAISEALVPLLSQPEATATGWLVTVENFDSAFTWSYTTSVGSVTASVISATQTRLSITGVNGLTQTLLTVSTQRAGYQDGSMSRTLQRERGLIPVFGEADATQTSARVSISNYDASYTWAVTSSAGNAAISADGVVTITNLQPASFVTITVQTQRFGYTTVSTEFEYASLDENDQSILEPALVPEFGNAISTVDGFTVQVTNYDASFRWSAISTRGEVEVSSSGFVTVTGLGVGETATVTVVSNKSTTIGGIQQVHASGVNRQVGSAEEGSALSFTLSSPIPTVDGFTSQINGYDADSYDWGATVSYGFATVSESGLVTVTGQNPGQQNIQVEVSARRPGYATAIETITGATIRGVAYIPVFGSMQPTVDGFVVPITNYDTFGGTLTWTPRTTDGSVSLSSVGHVTVSGLDAGDTARITVETTHANRRSGESSFNGGALGVDGITPAVANGLTPSFGAIQRTADGFTVSISNFDSRYTYSTVLTRGTPVAASVSSVGLITVTGVQPGDAETVTVLTNRSGYRTGNATVSGIALATGTRASNLLTGQTLGTICNTSSPAREGVSNVNDLSSTTPFACFNSASRAIAPYATNSVGFYTGNIGNVILESIAFTSYGSADDAERDPATYSLWGCVSENQFCSAIVSNDTIGFDANRSSRDVTRNIRNARAYNFYRLTFGSTRGTSNMVQIGEVSFSGRSAIAPALNPILTTPIVTSSGFTTSIRNHSNLYVWSATVTSPGIVAIGSTPDSNGALPVTVTNLPPNTEASLTINTSRVGHQNGGAAVSVTTSMGVALTPLLSQPVITTDGMRVRIENFNSSNYTWSAHLHNLPLVDGDEGEPVEISSNGLISITGREPGDNIRVIVTTSRVGYIDGTSSVDARILESGLRATFGSPTQTADGFRVQISNFDSVYNWRAVASNGGTAVISDSGLITVTNLGVGVEADIVVTSTRSGFAPASTTTSGSSLRPGLAPVFGTRTATETGFSVEILNYDAEFVWTFTASNSAAAAFDATTGIVSVTNVSSDTYLTVATSRSGYRSARASTALTFQDALTPEFNRDSLISTPSGVSVELSNFNPEFDWTVEVTPSGRAVLVTEGSGAGSITVTGAPSGVDLTISVSTSRIGYEDGLGVFVATTGLDAGLVPSFAEPIRLVGGYTIEIANFDPTFTWQVSSSRGTASITEGTVLVTGLAPIEVATVTVSTSKQGHLARSATSEGSALPLPALTPRFATPTSTINGYTTTITNYDPAFAWTASVDQGGTATISSTGSVTVTGIGGLTTATLTVTTTRTGYVSGGSSTVATSLPFAPLVPQFGITQSTRDGFIVPISNFDPQFTYDASSSDVGIEAEVTEDGDLVVTGGDLYDFITVDVATSRRGYTDGQASVSAFALQEPQTSLSTITVVAISYDAAAGTAIVTTGSAHGLLDPSSSTTPIEVVISGIDERFDGRHTVTELVNNRNDQFVIRLSTAQSEVVQFLAAASSSTASSTGSQTSQQSVRTLNEIIDVQVSGVMRNGDERQITLNLNNPNSDIPLRSVIYIPYSAANPNARFTATALMSEAVPAGYRMVRLTAEDVDGSPITQLNVPVRIKMARPSLDAIPVYSGDGGVTWRLLTRLESAQLPDGVQDGFFVDADGDMWVLTRHLSMFGALAPQAVPIVLSSGASALTVGQTTLLTISGGEGDGVLSAVSLTPEVCSLSADNTVTALAVGECVIEATKAASGRFVAATNRLSLSIAAVPVIETPTAETPGADGSKKVAAKKKKKSSTVAVPVTTDTGTDTTDDLDSVDDGSGTDDGGSTDADNQGKGDEGPSIVGGWGIRVIVLLLLVFLGAGVASRRRRGTRGASTSETAPERDLE